ncbi:folylpolyglutamate synthase/dihydrofolate synthase family protein [Synechocystis salina]|uniref:hypothetical protein n=1 Tax=Synechocystis salina TaxID=945780 RepID=UPI002AD40F8C|nr:hypothetical protein [Synechocystis salina]
MDINTLLEPYKTAGVNLGLERIHGLLAKLGNPQAKVPYIHVGGTNGKGSVCAYLSSVLAEAGYKVGRYTSPHLIDWQERVWLNNHFIDNHDLMAVLQQVTAIAKADSADRPTLFEVFTAAVWLYFAQAEVDIAVMEVGLGEDWMPPRPRTLFAQHYHFPQSRTLAGVGAHRSTYCTGKSGHSQSGKAGIFGPHPRRGTASFSGTHCRITLPRLLD